MHLERNSVDKGIQVMILSKECILMNVRKHASGNECRGKEW